MTAGLGERTRRPISGNLVVLHLLSACDQGGVQDLRSLDLLHHLTGLVDEAPLAEVVVPRLIAAGADRSKVLFASRAKFSAIKNLRAYIQANDIRLIVLSPMLSFLNLKDINGELGVREVLEKLQANIENLDCAVVCIAHTNKKPDLAAIERILGAVAFTNFVRAVLLTAIDDPDEGTYRMVLAKHNLSMPTNDLILRPVYVGDDPEHRDQYVKLHWSEPENGNAAADAVFDRQRADGKPKAVEWLRKHLKEHGETLSEHVIVAAACAGYSESAIRKAMVRRPDLFESRREGFPSQTWWKLR
jgi:hypothetical protein